MRIVYEGGKIIDKKIIGLNKNLEDYCEEARLYVESLTIINSIYNLFTENKELNLLSLSFIIEPGSKIPSPT